MMHPPPPSRPPCRRRASPCLHRFPRTEASPPPFLRSRAPFLRSGPPPQSHHPSPVAHSQALEPFTFDTLVQNQAGQRIATVTLANRKRQVRAPRAVSAHSPATARGRLNVNPGGRGDLSSGDVGAGIERHALSGTYIRTANNRRRSPPPP